jgi:hypothetical protein
MKQHFLRPPTVAAPAPAPTGPSVSLAPLPDLSEPDVDVGGRRKNAKRKEHDGKDSDAACDAEDLTQFDSASKRRKLFVAFLIGATNPENHQSNKLLQGFCGEKPCIGEAPQWVTKYTRF